jgi:phage shock protein PspC (stress-responsive transcriptional regulator)
VDTGHDHGADEASPRPRTRRLWRIRDGQELAGVCNGLAAYAELPVDWVRAGFVLATVFTAGIFGLVYVALAFILRVAPTRHSVDIQRP